MIWKVLGSRRLQLLSGDLSVSEMSEEFQLQFPEFELAEYACKETQPFELHLSYFQDPANCVPSVDVKDETLEGICPFAVMRSVGI